MGKSRKILISTGFSAVTLAAFCCPSFFKTTSPALDGKIPGASAASIHIEMADPASRTRKLDLLAKDLDAKDDRTRLEAISELSNIRDERAIDLLVDRLSIEKEPILRVRILGSLRWLGTAKSEEAIIRTMNQDHDPAVRAEAVQCLPTQRSERSVDAAIARLPKEPAVEVREAIIFRLDDRRNKKMMDSLARWYAKERDPHLKATIMRTITAKPM